MVLAVSCDERRPRRVATVDAEWPVHGGTQKAISITNFLVEPGTPAVHPIMPTSLLLANVAGQLLIDLPDPLRDAFHRE